MRKTFTLLLTFAFCSFALNLWAAEADIIEQQDGKNTTRVVTGVVTDGQNSPLIGANVVIKGSTKGVSTGVKGDYAIHIPSSGATLIVSYLGMVTKNIVVTNQQSINVKLDYSNQTIGEVMVVGAYGGVQKKSDMVGSAFQVNADQIKTLPAARIDNILEGLVPGFTIEPNTDVAQVRTRYNTRIRGNTSLSAGREPLWIIDGVPMYTGDKTNQVTGMSYAVSPLSFIDANDIESITVLKDATETTIYGANGSNGIILVTTKKGSKDRKSIDVSLKYGIGMMDKSTQFKTLNGSQYMMLAKEAWNNAGINMHEFPYQDSDMNSYSTTNINWADQFFGIGNTMQANVSMSGGSESMSNFFSVNYYGENPMVKGNTQQRISTRLNSDLNIAKGLKASVRLSASYNINELFSPSRDYVENLPIISPYDEAGYGYRLKRKDYTKIHLEEGDIDPWTKLPVSKQTSVIWPLEYNFFNSLAERDENDNRQRALTTVGSVSMSYQILDGLSITAMFGVDYKGYFEDRYEARTNLSGMSWARQSNKVDPEMKMLQMPVGISTRGQSNFLSWNNVEHINYSKQFGKHNVSAMAAFEMTNKEYQTIQSTGNGFPNDNIKEVTYAEQVKGYSSSSTVRSMSYFFQGKYSYDNRYYLTMNFRSDGNSDFGEYSQWANFASAGLSWNIHNEEFFDVSFMNKLKLRFSYGNSGNSRVSGAISYGVYSTSNSNSYNNKLGSVMTEAPNPGLTWESTFKTNIGVDMGLFNCIDIGVEYYSNMTKDLLSQLYVSRTIGQSRVWRNVGRVRNRGVELTINSSNIKTRDFQWNTDFNISHNKNKIIELNNGQMVSFGSTAWVEGQDMDAFMLIRWAGVDPRDGKPLWYDKNGDITRTYNYDNRVPYKTSRPTVYGGFGNTVQWKSVGLRVFINYSIGGYEHASYALSGMTDGYDIMSKNQAVEMLNRWQKPGDLSPNPQNIKSNPMKTGSYNSRFLYNKTNIRLSNLAVFYDLPKEICKSMRLSRVKMTFICDNLAIWTPKDSKNQNSYKTLMSGYPMQRNFSINLDLSF